MRDAVVMGVFQSPVRMSLRRVRAQCRQPAEGSFDPIGITHENHNRLTGLTPWAMLALWRCYTCRTQTPGATVSSRREMVPGGLWSLWDIMKAFNAGLLAQACSDL